MDPEALFERAGDARFVPSALTTGPWRSDAMHGGPPSALAGRMVETLRRDGEFVARVNVELERPVPLEPLTASVARRDVSRRVSHVDVRLALDNGATVVSARALVLAVAPLPDPDWRSGHDTPEMLGPDHTVAVPAWASGEMPTTYHQHAVEHRMPPGSSFDVPGAATSWVRLRRPLVLGEETSGLCRLLAAADFGSGISAIYGADAGVGLINADLSVALGREASGEWVRIGATTSLDASGTALCVTRIHDALGPVGVATQSLLGLRFAPS